MIIDYATLLGIKPATVPEDGKAAAHEAMRERKRRERPTKDELTVIRERILALVLQSGPIDTATVAAAMDCTHDYALKRLHDLRKAGRLEIVRQANGRRARYLWGAA